MTTHSFIARRILRPPIHGEGRELELDSSIISALERVADGLPIGRTPLRRLTARRLAHRNPLERIDQPVVGDLTPKGQEVLDLVYSRRSRLALALLGDP